MKALQTFFTAPIFEGDEEKTGRARLLHVILMAQTYMLLLFAAVNVANVFTTGTNHLPELFVVLAGLFVVLFWRFLMQRGQIKLASTGLITAFLVSITILFVLGGTIRTPSVIFLPLTVVMATLLIGKRTGITFFIISSIIGVGLIHSEISGLLPAPDNAANPSFNIIVIVGLGLNLLLLYLATQNTENAMKRAVKNEQEVRSLVATLEQRVNDRTAIAEAARAEAETATAAAQTARKELEAQVWLVTGQAHLADAIRGEHNIDKLAENIIAQISQYLGAQAGALYLLERETLKLTGSYAITPRPGFDGNFKLGEGLVGQAAVDNRAMLVSHPENAIVISSGLIDLTPIQMLVVPFEEGGQVVGVCELATLTEFTQAHKDFLQRVSESIGIAFRTVQARQRLADALMETQQQAEELQAQEEELRAANEELQSQTESANSARKASARKDAA